MFVKKSIAFVLTLIVIFCLFLLPVHAIELPEQVFPTPQFSYGGASVLKPEISEKYNTQSIRVYYEYATTPDGKIKVGEKGLSIKERGVLIKAADTSDTALTVSNIGKGGVIVANKTQNFGECWNNDTVNGKLTYSIYVANFDKNDTRKIAFRGYIILEDNLVYYTETVYLSVSEIIRQDITDVY